MPRTVTGTELVNRIRQLSDTESATTRFPDAEILEYANQGVAAWWDIIIASRGWSWCGKTYLTYDTVTSSGTTPPTVGFTGVPASEFQIQIDITTGGARGTAEFRWSINGGTSWAASGVLTAATVALGNTGITATFAVGTYNVDNLYTCNVILPTTVLNQSAYELPSDFYKLQNVLIQSTGWIGPEELPEIQRTEEGIVRNSHAASWGSPYGFMLRGGRTGACFIEFVPEPSSGTKYRLNYFPSATEITATSDVLDTLNGWGDEYAAHFAARLVALKDELFDLADRLERQIQNIEKRIRSATSGGRSVMPTQIQDVKPNQWLKYRRRWLP